MSILHWFLIGSLVTLVVIAIIVVVAIPIAENDQRNTPTVSPTPVALDVQDVGPDLTRGST